MLPILPINKKRLNPFLILGFLFFLYFLIKSFFKEKLHSLKLEKDSIQSNLTDTQAAAKSIALFGAMDRVFGTTERVIYEELTDINKFDYAKISKHFGLKPYNQITGNSSISILDKKLDLTGWLSSELNSDEKDKVNSLLDSGFVLF